LGVASTGALQKEKGVEMDFSHIDEKGVTVYSNQNKLRY
jgi:hypothetical protein